MKSLVACSLVLLACGGAADTDLLTGTPVIDGGAVKDSSIPTKDSSSTGDTGAPDAQEIPDVNQPDTSPTDPGILCGVDMSSNPKYCTVPGNYCCDDHGSFTCYPTSNAGACAAALNIECDDQSDCAGKICCGDLASYGYQQVTCKSKCSGYLTGGVQQIRFCDPTASTDECTSQGQTCKASGVLLGYYVCQ